MGKDLKGKELGQGICQRKDGTYQGRYIDRFGKRQYIYCRKLSELRIALAEAITENKTDPNVIREPITLDEWFAKWLKTFKLPYLNESTVWVYEGYYYQRVSPTLGKKKLTDIDELAIRELLAKIKEDGYAYSSQVKVKKLLSQMFEAAVDNNYAKVNPVKKIKLGKDDTNKPIHALTQEEQKIFMQFSQGKFYHNAYMLQLFTGIRPGELFALKTSDINFEDKTISVERTLLYKKGIGQKCGYRFHEPKTDASKRIIPMSNECEKILRQQIELKSGLQNEYPQQDEDFKDLLFTTSTNTPLNTSAYNSSIKLLTNRIRKNGYEIKHFTGHDLRHTFATRCYESGITPKTIQIYMGHSSLQMTMDIYTHVFKDHKSKEIYKLDELNLSMMTVS